MRRTEFLVLKVTEEEKEQVRAAAEAEQRSMSNLLRRAFIEYVSKDKPDASIDQ